MSRGQGKFDCFIKYAVELYEDHHLLEATYVNNCGKVITDFVRKNFSLQFLIYIRKIKSLQINYWQSTCQQFIISVTCKTLRKLN